MVLLPVLRDDGIHQDKTCIVRESTKSARKRRYFNQLRVAISEPRAIQGPGMAQTLRWFSLAASTLLLGLLAAFLQSAPRRYLTSPALSTLLVSVSDRESS